MSSSQDRFYRACSDLLRVLLVIVAIRGGMLLLGQPIIFIPYFDDLLLRVGYETGEFMRGLASASWWPRF